MRKSLNREYIFLIIIFISGFFFRFFDYYGFSLSNDELSAINRLDFKDLHELIINGIRPDGHPALAQLLLWFHTKLFGISPASVRFPFVLISSFAPVFAYLFMKNITGKSPALFLSAAIALLQFPLLYGRIARPYGIGLTFVLLSAWLWSVILFDLPKKKRYRIIAAAGLGISWALSIYTHYFAALTVVIIGITGLFLLNKNNRKYYLSASILTVLLFIPHAEITIHQISLGGVGQWLGEPQPSFFYRHILYIFNGSLIILLLSLLIFPKDFSKKQNSKLLKIRFILALWFLIPLITGYLYSVLINPVLQNSVLIFSMPFLLAFLFSFNYQHFSNYNKIALIVFSVILTANLLFPHSFFKKQHFAEFKQTSLILNDLNKKYGKDNITDIVEINSPAYLNYYAKQQNINLDFISGKFNNEKSFNRLKTIIDSIETEYIAFCDIQNTSSFVAKAIIFSKYGEIIDIHRFGDKTTVIILKKQAFTKAKDTVLEIRNKYCCGRTYDISTFMSGKNTAEIKIGFTVKSSENKADILLVYDVVDKNDKSLIWRGLPLRYLIENNGIINVFLWDKFKTNESFEKVKIYFWNKNK